MTGKTMKNTLQIYKSVIVVSKNEHIDGGYYFGHKVWGILPGCRKVQLLSVSPSTGKIWVNPLFSHSGTANILPTVWADLINNSPVIVERLIDKETILTPDLIEKAREHALKITTCNAIIDTTYGKNISNYQDLVVN